MEAPGIAAVSSGLPECCAGELLARAPDRLFLRAGIGLKSRMRLNLKCGGLGAGELS